MSNPGPLQEDVPLHRLITSLVRPMQWLTGSKNLRTDNFLHLWIYLAVGRPPDTLDDK